MLRVGLICRLILSAIQGIHPKSHKSYLLSIDEKTGIQALERLEQTAPLSKGGHTRREWEYKRHGTTTLIAALDVGSGKLHNYLLNPTRTEVDFQYFIEQTVLLILSKDPDAHITLLTDQLNTHLSESLVIWAARINRINGNDQDLGIKGKIGILKNQQTRMAFLENDKHPIRFVFTPKHCSWLNPIENWFAKLQKHVITNGNFKSVKELNTNIEKYIPFYNNSLIKPLKWKFSGFIKSEKLSNFKSSKN